MEITSLPNILKAMKTCHYIKRLNIYILFSALPVVASAQLNESINVEGKYVPEVIRLERINTFPTALRFNLESNPLNYEVKGLPVGFNPSLLPMPAIGWGDSRQPSRHKGYLELGAGSWLNSTLSAGYRFIDSETMTLGVRLQHNSTSLWKPEMNELYKDVRQFRYDENIGVYYSSLFRDKGRLNAAIDYHYGNFNYYGFHTAYPLAKFVEVGMKDKDVVKAPAQTINDVSARIGWESTVREEKPIWNAMLGVRYFGYGRSIFEYGEHIDKETHLYLKGGLSYSMAENSSVGMDVNADVLIYNSEKDDDRYLWDSMMYDRMVETVDNYGRLSLKPYYNFKRDNLNIKLGVDLDFSNISSYSKFHIAPDLRADFKSGPAGLFLHLLGGSRLNTLASSYQLDYYQGPKLIGGTTPVYTPLDGELGINFGPFSGFSASLSLRYRVSRNEKLGGWYQTSMNQLYSGVTETEPFLSKESSSEASKPIGSLSEEFKSVYYYGYGSVNEYNIHGASLALGLEYSYGKLFTVKAAGTYQKQSLSSGYFNGYDRPRWTADFSAEVNPVSPLKVRLSYEYRGVRNIFIKGIPSEASGDMNSLEPRLGKYRLPDITYLNLGASWSFSDTFSVWLQGNNLLNRHDEILPSLPTQGICLTGGISWLF